MNVRRGQSVPTEGKPNPFLAAERQTLRVQTPHRGLSQSPVPGHLPWFSTYFFSRLQAWPLCSPSCFCHCSSGTVCSSMSSFCSRNSSRAAIPMPTRGHKACEWLPLRSLSVNLLSLNPPTHVFQFTPHTHTKSHIIIYTYTSYKHTHPCHTYMVTYTHAHVCSMYTHTITYNHTHILPHTHTHAHTHAFTHAHACMHCLLQQAWPTHAPVSERGSLGDDTGQQREPENQERRARR